MNEVQKLKPHRGGFFKDLIADIDPEVQQALDHEMERQQNQIELIASENIASRAVLEANGSILTNKYAEGYPGRRYYGGCEYVDVIERLAIDRAKRLFGCSYANVQPHSGAQANGAVYLALLKPGDTLMGMSLAHGGHLTHGAAPAQSGKWFNSVQYGVNKETGLIDYAQVEELVHQHKPSLIVMGASAYTRKIDWEKFRRIADDTGAYLMADIAHYAGLVATGMYPSPFPYADIVTTTTHKTLRGPSGGMILSNDEELGKKLNRAVFPGLQGKPLAHVIAAKAVAFKEALDPSFKEYAAQVVKNAQAMAETLMEGGLATVSGGTDCHMVLVDLRPKGLTGDKAEKALERANITCNKNAVPFDPEKPMVTSGIRVGSPACTTRGFGEEEFRKIANMMLDVLDSLAAKGAEGNAETESRVQKEVRELCASFPIY